MRDHNNERGFVHPDLTGRFAIGFTDEDGWFNVLWTDDDDEFMSHCQQVKNTRKLSK